MITLYFNILEHENKYWESLLVVNYYNRKEQEIQI